MTVSPLEAFRRQATRDRAAVALVEPAGATWTRGALLDLTDAIRAGLEAEGFAAGDRVLFSVRPGAAALALVLAAHDLGGVLVPQDPGVGDSLFAARLGALEPRWVFAEGVLLARPGSLAARALRWLGVPLAPIGGVTRARFVSVGFVPPGAPRTMSLERLVERGQGVRARNSAASPATARGSAPTIPDDAEAFIVQTSGTTDAPRAVVHTRRSLAAVLDAVDRELALGPADVLLARDLHLLLPALARGAVAVVPPGPRFDAAAMLRAMARHGVTHAFLVTRDCRLLLEECRSGKRCFPVSLRSLMIGAAPVRSEFLAGLRAVLPVGCTAWCVYGATEFLPIARVSLDEKVAWSGAGDLVGRPLHGASVRVRDDGQLVVSGERLCRGYLGEAPMAEFVTGDLARVEDGRIVLVGRAKDMIIRGEHNIYPGLHEPLVERIPGVRRAAMLGDFDPVSADESVILVVEPEQGVDAEQLRARVERAVREGVTRLDRAALPDRVLVRALPESGRSHKLDKDALRRDLGARSPVR